MIPVFVPNYYKDFRCIAAACKHSCCIGWEIDVDGEALASYDQVEGDLGARLEANIDREADPPCFKLTPDERCPFLNKNGLCDLITALGEDSLCHICADHPRFRNIMNDRVEIGLGLCCEAAARLILSQSEPFSVVELDPALASRERYAHGDPEPPDEISAKLLALRSALLAILQNREIPLSDRIRHVLTDVDIDWTVSVPEVFTTYAHIAVLLRDMERLDPAWDDCLDALEALPEDPLAELNGEDRIAFEHLLCYFLYRYLAAEDDGYGPVDTARVRVLLAMLCTAIIHAVHRAVGGEDLDSLCEISRMFSSEIEYSEENLERLIETVGEWIC